MSIAENAGINFFGTQDTITTTGGSIANDAYASAGSWQNDDDSPFVSFVFHGAFTSTMPTVGSIDLIARLMNIQSTNDEAVPDASYPGQFLGSFAIDFNESAGTEFWSILANVQLPVVGAAQDYDFYLLNNATGQTMTANWELYATPYTLGPHPA
jgi:hypothetical protein